MTVERMDHVGIVVDDLEAAKAFFVELGLDVQGEWPAEGEWVGRVIGLEGVQADAAMLQTPDGNGRVELVKFRALVQRLGLRVRIARERRVARIEVVANPQAVAFYEAVGFKTAGEAQTRFGPAPRMSLAVAR